MERGDINGVWLHLWFQTLENDLQHAPESIQGWLGRAGRGVEEQTECTVSRVAGRKDHFFLRCYPWCP